MSNELKSGDWPIVLCVGLLRSASTWTFNASVEVLRLRSSVVGVYSDHLSPEIEGHLNQYSCVVLKSHWPDSALRVLARHFGAPIILSIRDPRDCVVSLMRQFGYDFDGALHHISSSAKSILDIAEAAPTLVVRYEAPGLIGPRGVSLISHHIGSNVSDEEACEIWARLTPTEISTYIDGLAATGAFDDRPAKDQWDPVTLWHPNHIGDGATGKFASALTDDEIGKVWSQTKEFCDRFGYSGAVTGGVCLSS